MTSHETDILILGGGVVGLWALARLRQAGYHALLVERQALGAGQTLAAQGIVHGGMKYAINGVIGDSTRALADLPARWRACLAGRGELDLRRVPLLAERQLMWTTGRLDSRLAGVFSGALLRGGMARLPRGERPAPFDHPAFDGDLYALDEPVLDLPALVRELAELGSGAIHCAGESPLAAAADAGLQIDWRLSRANQGLRLETPELTIHADQVALCAGAGNAALLDSAGRDRPAMQRRPLHMVAVRGPLPPLFGHCLAARDLPRLTLTSHPGGEDSPEDWCTWYLGGELAESGVGITSREQIDRARTELSELLPWVDTRCCDWTTLAIDRAELASPGGRRPSTFALESDGPLHTLWPTKLALTPALVDRLLERLPPPRRQIRQPPWGANQIRIAPLPWEAGPWQG